MGKDKAGNTASEHVHNDHGGQSQQGDFLITKCTCGTEVARDFNPGDNPNRKK